MTMRYQVADVTKPLCSVGRVCDTDKFVVFGKKGGYIKDRWGPGKLYFQRDGGVYMLRSWVPTKKVEDAETPATQSTGFSRQG